MILYTPLQESEVFPAKDEHNNRHYIVHEGRTFCVEQSHDGSYEVIQLLSTDPQDYLNNKYAPGTIILNNDSIYKME